jgi:tetratricopeptide (TPR) repeat protein
MKYILYFLIIINVISLSSNENYDQIKNSYFKLNKYNYPWEEDSNLNRDSLYIIYYIRLAEAYSRIPDSSLIYFDKANQLIKTKKFENLYSIYYTNLGVFYGIKEDPENSISNFKLAESYSEKYNDEISKSLIFRNLALIYYYTDNYLEFLEYFKKAISQNTKNDWYHYNVQLWNEKANYHLIFGDTLKAKEALVNLLETTKKPIGFYKKAVAYTNYFNLLTEIDIESISKEVDTLSNMADTIRYDFVATMMYKSLGSYFLKKNQPDSALMFFNKAISKESSPSNFNSYDLKLKKVQVHFTKGDINKSKDLLAEIELEKLPGFDLSFRKIYYLLAYQIDSTLNNSDAAILHYDNYLDIVDSLNKIKNEKRIKYNELKVEVELMEIKNLNLELEKLVLMKETRLRSIIIASLIIISVLIIIFIIYRNKNKRKLQIEKENN